jgi:DNA-binding NarL/FixJ family response regulator
MTAVDLHTPDAAAVGGRMPPTRTSEGIDGVLAIRAAHPGTAVVVLSHAVDPELVMPPVQQNASIGYLLKDRMLEPSALAAAVRRVVAG